MMASLYYIVCFAIAVVLLAGYLFLWDKRLDMHFTLIFIIIPIVNLAYYMISRAQSLEAAIIAIKFSYLDGCFLPLILLLAVLSICDIKLKRWLRCVLMLAAVIAYLSVLTIGSSPLYYESITMDTFAGTTVLHKQYGPAHTVVIAVQFMYYLATMGAIIYSYVKKNQVSHKNLFLVFLTESVSAVCFFFGKDIAPGIELLPASYDFGLIVYLTIVYRLSLYDVVDTAIESLARSGGTGFVSFDFGHRYLGSNETARRVFPTLDELVVDRTLVPNNSVERDMLHWIDAFAQDPNQNMFLFKKGDEVYRIDMQYLYGHGRKSGYQLVITDDTETQHYIKLLNSYNGNLKREVQEKTAHIVEMHDNLVMSMAMMVESRDNSTGGHIRRTSEGVRLLVREMRKEHADELTLDFCAKLIKAAPMHDLGKIAVDDDILCKPGRYTPEEFEQMKLHAAEGARIVKEILSGTDDEEFKRIAENVAHYHHERWDGSGYPEGLKGEQIPLEARVMAIADVYDALVSKRVYKEAMSFEEANAIILEGMGTQFDKGLEKFYVRARPHLEAYYKSLEQSEEREARKVRELPLAV
ncbi:MAG: HD domain-containing protein [Coriobacteriales bacterium]|nr:HD domain-containing protein [Coriobacteriales bacterium]